MTLKIAKRLIETLEANQVSYCHWKSNQHLQEGLTGITDLDILVNSEQDQNCTDILKQLAFVKITSLKTNYPGIEDWLGFDHETGALIHLHLHYKLILGEKGIKSIHLPLENWLLSNKIVHEGVKVPAHECELLLLVIRIVLKTDGLGVLKAIIKRRAIYMPAGTQKEFDWLLERWNTDRFLSLFNQSSLPLDHNIIIQFIKRYESKRLTVTYMLKTKTYLLRRLKPYSRYSSFNYLFLKVTSFITDLPFLKRFKVKSKKHLAHQTLFFALLGADGSGKTRLVKDLKKWLGWKLEVKHFYFGIPKKQLLRRLLKKTVSSLQLAKKVSHKLNLNFIASLFGSCATALDSFYWLYLGRLRFLKYKKALGLAATGQVVIAERYPLEALNSMKTPMDGPRIPFRVNNMFDKLASLERGYYKRILTPQVLFILQAELSTLRNRKDDLDLTKHVEKSNAVNQLSLERNYFFVNAGDDYHLVLMEIKKKIWFHLSPPFH